MISTAAVLWALSAVVLAAMLVAPTLTYRVVHVLVTGRDGLPPTGFAAHHDQLENHLLSILAVALGTWAAASLVAGVMAILAWRSEHRAARRLAARVADLERMLPAARER